MRAFLHVHVHFCTTLYILFFLGKGNRFQILFLMIYESFMVYLCLREVFRVDMDAFGINIKLLWDHWNINWQIAGDFES